MPTIATSPTRKARLQNTTEHSFGQPFVTETATQRLELLMVTTHPDSAAENAGDVVTVSAEFGERSVLIDLTEVTSIDSWGLALFVEAMHRITALGGKLVIFGLRENIFRVFETAKLDQIFHICPSREEALAVHLTHRRPSIVNRIQTAA